VSAHGYRVYYYSYGTSPVAGTYRYRYSFANNVPVHV
jgi:hypothetical protein